MSNIDSKQYPIINCHTHIFTGDHVPPYLAKSFVPFPFYFLINLHWVVSFFRKYHRVKAKFLYHPSIIKWKGVKNKAQLFINQFGFLKSIVTGIISIQTLFIAYRTLTNISKPSQSTILIYLQKVYQWLDTKHLLLPASNSWLDAAFIAFVILFIPNGRSFILFLLSKLWSFIGIFSHQQSKELMHRYLNIGRYAFHKQQATIFGKLRAQYPADTGFILLPMDMEYMQAGKVKMSYHEQMKELATIKENYPNQAYPFVFADPRRLEEESTHFQYTILNGRVELQKCFIKEYLEEYGFNGIKIYPALGYYPFDEELLPLWKYAADKGIPILTHCIRGTIFYRGKKKASWNRHPVIEQTLGKNQFEPMLLPDMDPMLFSYQFTHPLNYLCLLEEKLLRKIIAATSAKCQQLFGYSNSTTPLQYNLNHLKICFGHFGGEDEWKRFFERDRDNYSAQLVKQPETGISFLTDANGKEARGKLEIIWKNVDWYTIICSLMMQYPNVYADISYILHDETSILPLLKQTLQNKKLREKVLYGTDFFVVRNHKSDRQMLADMSFGLSPEDFDQIARENPLRFLERNNPL
jgi:predicted TIM-barrel fold metal-dependent hydrolase